MGQPYSSVFPDTAHDGQRHRRKTRRPVTERVADWSARHRKTAVFGWLLLVAAVFMAGQATGSRQLPQYDAGQSGRAERVLNQDEPAQLRPYALVAAGTPLLLAVTALTASPGVLMIVSHVLPVVSSTYEVVVVIGMAVGVDYSLFYLRREREERARGRSFPEALRIASRTSGHTILMSGLTVMTALCGLFVPGGPFLGMAAEAIAVVAIAVAGSLTVLPALLAWLGPRADAGRITFLGRPVA